MQTPGPPLRQGLQGRGGEVPLKVLPQIWQKWGRPSWWRLATCRSRGPFSVKRCSQNSQLKGRSPVWVRLCLSRLAVGRDEGQARGPGPGQGGQAGLTLGAEGLATEVTLEGLLARVCAQVCVEIGLLGEGMAAELTDVGPLIPVGVRDTEAITEGRAPFTAAQSPPGLSQGNREAWASRLSHSEGAEASMGGLGKEGLGSASKGTPTPA